MIGVRDSKALLSLLAGEERPLRDVAADFGSVFSPENRFHICCSLAILIEDKKMLKTAEHLVAFVILQQAYAGQPPSSNPFLSTLISIAGSDSAEKAERAFILKLLGPECVEAAAYGLPVVATKNGGPVDILKALNNGLLIDPHDHKAIADVLLRLVSDKSLWQVLRVDDLKQKLWMRGFRCNVVYTHSCSRLNVVPLFASRSMALRYLSVQWGIDLSKMVVFVGDKGDTDYEHLLPGLHKTLILRGTVECGSERLLRGSGRYQMEDVVPKDAPNICTVDKEYTAQDLLH